MDEYFLNAIRTAKSKERLDYLASVVRDDRSGLLVSRDEPEALSLAIDRIVLDVGLRERLGNAARRQISAEFESVDDRLQKEVDLVTEIARNRARP